MVVVFDNNVIIDALKPNPPFEGQARDMLRLVSEKRIDGFVSANSLTDIFYVLNKVHGANKTKVIIKNLLRVLDIISVEPADCVTALEKPMSDFEDALVDSCAQKINANYIISRDEAFIKAQTSVEVIAPGEMICYINP